MPTRQLLGCDFSSAPTRRKNIVVAVGTLERQDTVRLSAFHRFSSIADWADWLAAEPSWIGGFDLPFGLPRELVETLGWPLDWTELMTHYGALERPAIRRRFAAFCAARPVGGKFAHRATDGPAGSSPSMKWVNPPVAWMLHAGVPRLLAVGAHFPAHQPRPATPPDKVALEAYPGLLARELIGRVSYKSDDLARQTPQRQQARVRLLQALRAGTSELGLAIAIDDSQAAAIVADASGDTLDALLCLIQAAWAARHEAAAGGVEAAKGVEGPGFGLPRGVDPIEGWIVGAKHS